MTSPTGRIAQPRPNMQQISKGSRAARALREAFLRHKGLAFDDGDWPAPKDDKEGEE